MEHSPPSDPGDPSRRYVLGAEIGRGGLGRVVEAWDRALKRTVAVKLALETLPAALRDRFQRESEVTARLEHPNIVPVHDLWEGGDGGETRLHLAMKRIRGRDLGTLLKDLARGDAETVRTWSRARLLRIFQDICLGIAYAHANGVIHRDLKPSNVMIGEFGETLILDWGLAKSVLAEPARGVAGAGDLPEAGSGADTIRMASPGDTREGEIVGTPSYMPPEQAEGRLADVGARSDVYSLGAVLYELLTFHPPFEGATALEVITRVRAGAVEPPSARAHVPVPPELEEICLRALAFRPEDRYPSAKALHDDVQLFLEGTKERERRSAEAAERVRDGRAWATRHADLKGEIEEQEKVVAGWSAKIQAHQPVVEKRPLWDAKARLAGMRKERIEALSKATSAFGQALTADPESESASDGMCELLFARLLEAEADRDEEEVLFLRSSLVEADRRGRFRARLDAPGTLSLRTFAFGCDCLSPVRHTEWRVEIGDEATVPWRDGRARPDLPLENSDTPVPEVRTFPPGVRFGHAPGCVRSEVPGVEVFISRYEDRENRLVLGPERFLGRTPLAPVELPQGSWLCFLRHAGFAEVRLPVPMVRSTLWSQEVNLYQPREIPEGFCFVPAGPFTFGGGWAGGDPVARRTTEDLFVSRFPVTCAEYLEYLNDLCATGNVEEARKRQPRHADRRWWIERDGRFELPAPGSDPELAWDPRWPVMSITWFDAKEFGCWMSRRTGRRFEMLHEQEYEKTCRGVDGRTHSYGNTYDGTYSHTSVSLEGRMSPLPVGSFPADESPFGVRDLSGGIETWCANAPEVPYRNWRCLRGGAWGSSSPLARAGYRHGTVPTHLFWRYGVRMVVRPSRASSGP
ncbi:MAG: SUMF1/EgtB/PvdO family nonheme iron enzyme [Candidatus Brocadiae bacterium]|nr:SUMF1/EgtB/PvdO family nonheme iron enzyme [Candidatus Brocadiia bacterium]